MEKAQNIDISEKNRRMAAIAYFFLSPLFLLSRDEDIAHPFTRAHTRKAFVIFLGFIGVALLHVFLSGFDLSVNGIAINIIIEIGILIVLTALLILGARSALRGGDTLEDSENTTDEIRYFSTDTVSDESERVMIFLSYIPFLSLFLDLEKDKKAGIYVSTFFISVVIILGILFSGADISRNILIFLYIVFLIALVMSMMIYGQTLIPRFFKSIPDASWVRSIIWWILGYLGDIVRLIMGHEVKLDLGKRIASSEDTWALSIEGGITTHFIAYIPVVNLFLIPQALQGKIPKEVFWQWIILTILATLGVIFGDFEQQIWIVLGVLLLMCTGWRGVRIGWDMRVLGLYEIYSIFSFGRRRKWVQSTKD